MPYTMKHCETCLEFYMFNEETEKIFKRFCKSCFNTHYVIKVNNEYKNISKVGYKKLNFKSFIVLKGTFEDCEKYIYTMKN